MRFHGFSGEVGDRRRVPWPSWRIQYAGEDRPTRETRRMAELPHGTAPRVKLVWMILAVAPGFVPATAGAALLAADTRDSLTVAECVAQARERAPEVQARLSELAG